MRLSIPVWIHTHDTAGLGAGTYMAAIDAGVDAIDLSIAPFANGTGQPDTTRMLALLEGMPAALMFRNRNIIPCAQSASIWKRSTMNLRTSLAVKMS